LAYDGQSVAALVGVAETYKAQNDPRALSFYKQAMEKDPRQEQASRGVLELAQKAGEFDTAVVACRNLVALDKGDADSLFALATLYDQHLKQTAEAAKAYEEFVARFPKDKRAAAAHQRVGVLRPSPLPAPPPTVKRRTKPTPFALNAGDRTKAIALFNDGVRLQLQNRLDEALAHYDKAIAADQTFARAYFNSGTVHQLRGNLEKAITAYETAVRAQPDYLSAQLNYALALKAAGYSADAVEQFNRVLELNDDEASAHLELGNLYARSPATLEQARRHYERFVELAPTSAAAREVRRWLASKSGR
jgi:tetratricopeptide (TPR) repeat protein